MAVTGVQYASIEDFNDAGLPNGALASLDRTTINRALVRASALANTFLGDKFTLGLGGPPYDASLVDAVCQIAAWNLLRLRGFNPDNAGDQVVRQGYLDAEKLLTRIANGQAYLNVQQGTPESLQPDVTSNSPRGYGDLTGSGRMSNFIAGSNNWGT